MGEVGIPWRRRQWMRFIATLQDHPRVSCGLFLGVLAFAWVYLVPMRGFAHFSESMHRWRLEAFGGKIKVDQAIRLYDTILSFEPEKFDRLDVISIAWSYVPGTAFRDELATIINDRKGRVRMVTIDPRLAYESHPNHADFEALAKAFGQNKWEFEARCWYSTAVLLTLHHDFPDGFEVRFLEKPLDGAPSPYFAPARWGNAYLSEDPAVSLVMINPRSAEFEGADPMSLPGSVYKNRPNNAEVLKYQHLFDEAWANALQLDAALADELKTSTFSAPV